MELLVHAYQLEGSDLHSMMVALRQLNTVEEAEEDIHEVIPTPLFSMCVKLNVLSWWRRMPQ